MARHPDGRTESRSAAAWLDGLADDGEAGAAVPAVLRRMRPDMRTVHYDGELIGWVERFGERLPGTVTLSVTELTFRSADGTETRWSLDELTSIQPSSRTLVLGLGRGGAVALEFPTSSIMRWEQRLQKAVRGHWAATGRGEVVDYQPRIVAR